MAEIISTQTGKVLTATIDRHRNMHVFSNDGYGVLKYAGGLKISISAGTTNILQLSTGMLVLSGTVVAVPEMTEIDVGSSLTEKNYMLISRLNLSDEEHSFVIVDADYTLVKQNLVNFQTGTTEMEIATFTLTGVNITELKVTYKYLTSVDDYVKLDGSLAMTGALKTPGITSTNTTNISGKIGTNTGKIPVYFENAISLGSSNYSLLEVINKMSIGSEFFAFCYATNNPTIYTDLQHQTQSKESYFTVLIKKESNQFSYLWVTNCSTRCWEGTTNSSSVFLYNIGYSKKVLASGTFPQGSTISIKEDLTQYDELIISYETKGGSLLGEARHALKKYLVEDKVGHRQTPAKGELFLSSGTNYEWWEVRQTIIFDKITQDEFEIILEACGVTKYKYPGGSIMSNGTLTETVRKIEGVCY